LCVAWTPRWRTFAAANTQIKRATQPEAARWAALTGQLGAVLQRRSAPTDLTVIAERVHRQFRAIATRYEKTA
jgi:hypothetical protein